MSIQDDPAYLVCQIAPGGLSEAWSVNGGGLVVGRDGSAATIWQSNGAGVYVESALPTSVAAFPQALDVNDAGVVVGQDDRAVVWTPNGAGGYTEMFLRTVIMRCS